MFGKGKMPKSSNDKFVMAAGRAVGNISPPKGAADRKGNGSAAKSAPVKSEKGAHSTKPLYTKSGRTYTGKGEVKLP
jgi:hypothetical protein